MLVEQLWNRFTSYFLKERDKYKLKDFFQKRNSWPLEYHRDPALALCNTPSICCWFVSDHRKAPPRIPRLRRWPPSLPVIQTHSLHESNWLSHCHWEVCGRTEELDDFQHANGEWQQDKTEFSIVGINSSSNAWTYHSIMWVRIRSHLWCQCKTWVSFHFWLQLENGYANHKALPKRLLHYADVIMTKMASQITSLAVVYSTVYSDADQIKHQSSVSLAFVWRIHRDRWILRTKGQLRGKCFHLMTSSWSFPQHQGNPKIPEPGIHVHDYTCIYHKPDWLLQQFDE